MLELKNVAAGYGGNDVIKNISLTVGEGEVFCIAGPNGCGKSTLLKTITRILKYRGSITVDRNEVRDLPRRALAKKVALLSQSAQVYFPYTVSDTVALGRYAWGEGFLRGLSKIDKTVIEDTLAKLDLLDIKDRMIDSLSGGQLQRVFLARTLVQAPAIILLDEPTNHLDLKYQIELLTLLSRWVKDGGKTVIAVLHDLNLLRSFAGKAALMRDGELFRSGTAETVLDAASLEAVYGMDIHAFMRKSLQKW
jgi:iron complex transport system ATP-binding protein